MNGENKNYNDFPVPCSDDMAAQPQSFQACAQSLQADAETAPEPGSSCRVPLKQNVDENAFARPRDKIKMTGNGTVVEAEGLAHVLQPGGVFQIGARNDITVYHESEQKRRSKIKNKYKLTESLAEPGIQHLDVISAGLAQDWRSLGEFWKFDKFTLDQINLDFHREGQHEVNYRLLVKWKQKQAPVTLKMLANALLEIGRGDLADELHKG